MIFEVINYNISTVSCFRVEDKEFPAVLERHVKEAKAAAELSTDPKIRQSFGLIINRFYSSRKTN